MKGEFVMSKRAYTTKDKLEILKSFEAGHSIKKIASIHNVSRAAIREWKYRLDKFGEKGLKESSSWKKYSKELKLSAIREYQSGLYSLREITKKYEISDTKILRGWIKKYNDHGDIRATPERSKTKARPTTWEERIQIVLYCLENAKNFNLAAQTFDVSYQQVYQWVRKFESGGDEALRPKRGRNKSDKKLKLEIKQLKRENEFLRAENAFYRQILITQIPELGSFSVADITQ